MVDGAFIVDIALPHINVLVNGARVAGTALEPILTPVVSIFEFR